MTTEQQQLYDLPMIASQDSSKQISAAAQVVVESSVQILILDGDYNFLNE